MQRHLLGVFLQFYIKCDIIKVHLVAYLPMERGEYNDKNI